MDSFRDKVITVYRVCVSKAEVFFWVAFAIELFIMVAGFGAYEIPFRGRLTHIAFALFGLKIILTNYSKWEWLLIVLLGIVGTISYCSIDDEWVLRAVVMVIASKGMAFKKIVRLLFACSIVGLLLVVLLSFFKIGGDLTLTADFGRGGEETRWCLGFNHPNNLHGTFWYVIALGMVLYKRHVKIYQGIILTIANLLLYNFTVSRTGMLVAEIMIIGTVCYAYFPNIAKYTWVYLTGALGTVFLIGISIYSAAFGVKHNPVLYKFSQLLTDRLESLTWWEDFYSWTLFGAEFEKEPVDIGFITIVSDYGYVILALYLLVILLLIYNYTKKKYFVEFLVLMTCVFYTFMESTYVINVPLLCNFTFVLLLGTWDKFFKEKNMISEGNESLCNSSPEKIR